MTAKQTKTAENILRVMDRTRFANFYGIPNEDDESPFTKYLASYDDAPSRDEILEKIVELFCIDKDGNVINPYA